MKLNKFISKYQTSSKKKAKQYINQEKVKLNKHANILLIGCEGDTVKEMYQKLINQ